MKDIISHGNWTFQEDAYGNFKNVSTNFCI